MYNRLKHIAYILLPKAILKKNESFLRKFTTLFYLGNRFEYNICQIKLSRFATLENGTKICPNCGSLPRTRRLWQLIENKTSHKTILHFSPSKSLSNKIRETSFKAYITTDYEHEFEAEKHHNIEYINEHDNSFDLIICYHILEHVENDHKAMKELFRILKPNGECLIQTPFKEGEIYENMKIKSKEERLLHFGQEDHVRIYSVEGLKNRLEKAGFSLKAKTFKESPDNRFGLNVHETVLFCKK